jgi:hypothetical protein
MLVAALAGLLAVMGWWMAATARGEVGAFAVLDAPPGTEVVLSLLTVVSVDGPDRYTVGHAALHIPVVGPTTGIAPGREITLGGVVEAGHVRAAWVQPAPARRAKKGLGLAGLALGAALAAGSVRIGRSGLSIRG